MPINTQQLQTKYEKALDALATLKEASLDIGAAKELAQCAHKDPAKVYKTYRDSLVQRFEYTFDTTWKYMGEYLQFEGRTLAIRTPKEIFRESLKAKILSEPEVRRAIQMVDHRNLTTHGYDEQLIEEIVKSIPDSINLLDDILQRTKFGR